MQVEDTGIPAVKIVTPDKHGDARGFFSEVYSRAAWERAGLGSTFVQDNHSFSAALGTLRGLHFQTRPFAQDKLVRVTRGRILDVAVDIRRSSPTFGQHIAVELSAENWRQLLVPIGFAHAFITLEPDVEVLYKTTAPYSAANDRGIAWDDPGIGIAWPSPPGGPVLSDKDRKWPRTQRRAGSVRVMRIAVTGFGGQVARSLVERVGSKLEIVALGRPAFDLINRDAVAAGLEAARPDVIVNAAAYTAVDKAETEEAVATLVNGEGAGHVAESAARLGVPLLHLSTDYVFDGALDRPYREDDPTAPAGAYGRSKLAGEKHVAERCEDSVILRTAWVYSPFGANFVRTMWRLNETRDEVGVVFDQRGNPTSAPDIADALIAIAERVKSDSSPALRGIFHMTGSGEATWADFAEAIFREAETHGRRATRVKRIATADYPTPARRPANSCLDNEKLRRVYGLGLPDWRPSLAACCARLVH